MRSTEMYDLLHDAYVALIARDLWQPGGHEVNKHIHFCRYCSYSQEHGHSESCIVKRLERASVNGDGNASR